MRFQTLYRFRCSFCSNWAIDCSSIPAAPRLAFTRWKASQTVSLEMLYDFAALMPLFPAEAG
ncbi:hypothetical protein KPSA3_01184 [Pseudomonas syringae pv. actinidiae]|uniref:Uncharacterized protein n=1 Tax=Pseudomonas syringae pv. actinidiae TaxID=103796 RepID=A0AAN4Q1P8_PSESF|nr:hypothetical protein KPSA3_01184 [Pseudomonas syringae pv. actinidiae]